MKELVELIKTERLVDLSLYIFIYL